MKTAIALSTLAATAAAFAPAASSTQKKSTALQAKPFADALGVQPPVCMNACKTERCNLHTQLIAHIISFFVDSATSSSVCGIPWALLPMVIKPNLICSENVKLSMDVSLCWL